MPRFNVQHPVTKQWRCFSTIVDDYVTDWMDEERYEEAEEKIANRKRWEEGSET